MTYVMNSLREYSQTIIWTNAGLYIIGPRGINYSETEIEVQTTSLKIYIWKCRLQNSRQWGNNGSVARFYAISAVISVNAV